MKFTLEIELGNDEMQTINHIKEAINASINEATHKNQYHKLILFQMHQISAIIYDINGNKVGKWQIK